MQNSLINANTIKQRERIIIDIVDNLARRKVRVNNDQVLYIKKGVESLSQAFLQRQTYQDTIQTLSNIFLKDLQTNVKKIDMHEEMKKEIGILPETFAYNVIPGAQPSGDLSKETLEKLYNITLKAFTSKTYIVLDRRFQNGASDNRTKFSWSICDSGHSTGGSVVGIIAPLKDITKIRAFPFTFPKTDNTINSSRSISLTIEELILQSYNANPKSKSFHFLFTLFKPMGFNDYVLTDSGNSASEYEFFIPILELPTITISFGNPYTTLELDPDFLFATISFVGLDTILTFDTPHKCLAGDLIEFMSFNTSSPTTDFSAIQSIMSPNGWKVNTITPNTMSITTNITFVGNVINPCQIYFDSKRFFIRMELTFLKYR